MRVYVWWCGKIGGVAGICCVCLVFSVLRCLKCLCRYVNKSVEGLVEGGSLGIVVIHFLQGEDVC